VRQLADTDTRWLDVWLVKVSAGQPVRSPGPGSRVSARIPTGTAALLALLGMWPITEAAPSV